LTNQLIQTLLRDGPVAGGVGVHSMVSCRRLAVEPHAKCNGLSFVSWAEHAVPAARLAAKYDSTLAAAQHGRLGSDRPVALERPLVQREPRRNGILVRSVADLAARRGEALRTFMADVGLGRLHLQEVRREGGALPVDLDDTRGRVALARLGEQLLNDF